MGHAIRLSCVPPPPLSSQPVPGYNRPMKSAFVAIVGRPSTGKSTLLNKICGAKISITSETPQTTRNKIRGIVTRSAGQLVFVDTPGYHSSLKKYNKYLRELAESALEEVDLVLYLIDATRELGEEERELTGIVNHLDEQLVVAINKTDETGPALDDVRAFCEVHFKDTTVLEISALNGTGVDDLLQLLFELAPDGDPMYPEGFYTDQDPEFRISEIIREKALTGARQELPHAIYVEIADMEVKETGSSKPDPNADSDRGEEEDGADKTLWIRAVINVERESQQGMLVGRGGETIRRIREESRREILALFPYGKVYLDLRVKVDYKWRRKDERLHRMIT
jgi:GTPase